MSMSPAMAALGWSRAVGGLRYHENDDGSAIVFIPGGRRQLLGIKSKIVQTWMVGEDATIPVSASRWRDFYHRGLDSAMASFVRREIDLAKETERARDMMTPEEQSFLRAILSGDEAAPLMYADWLDGEGREEAALFRLGPWPRTEALRELLAEQAGTDPCDIDYARRFCLTVDPAHADKRSGFFVHSWESSLMRKAGVPFRAYRCGVHEVVVQVSGAYLTFEYDNKDRTIPLV